MFRPFAVASILFAYLGGALTLPGIYYKPWSVVLTYAAWRSSRSAHQTHQAINERPHLFLLLSVGSGLGFLSGLTGVGAEYSSALFFFSSIGPGQGRLEHTSRIYSGKFRCRTGWCLASPVVLPSALTCWAAAAVIGRFMGAEYGGKRLGNPAIRKLLAVVLLIAGAKIIATV